MSSALFSYTEEYAAQKGQSFEVSIESVDIDGADVNIVGAMLFRIYRSYNGSELLHEVAMTVATNTASVVISSATLEALPAGQRTYTVVNVATVVLSGPFELKQRDVDSRALTTTDLAVVFGTTAAYILAPAGGVGGVTVHNDLTGRSASDCHPISAITGLQAAINSSGMRFIPICAAPVSTEFDSTSKLVAGEFYFDPTDAALGTSGTSTATLEVLIQTTTAGNTVNCDLFRSTGAGSPTVVGTVTPSAGTTSTLVTLSVSAAFRPTTGVAGIFSVRIWLTTNNGTDYATCTMARIKLTP